jgi:hypothetical protein
MTAFTFRELDTAHKKCSENEELVLNAKSCACFHCLQHFNPTDIKDFAGDTPHRTAFCPKCGVDSILTDMELDKVPDDLLAAMQEEYFGPLNDDADESVSSSFEFYFENYTKDKAIRLFEADLIHADRAEKANK